MSDAPNPGSDSWQPRRFIEYPYPLREHFTARLLLPLDLSTAEAHRLSEFLMTLAVDYDDATKEDGDE
jgi:hypothetical protein